MAHPDPSYTAPSVENHAPKPPGVLPRNTQPWMLGAIALVMVLVIAFSAKNPPKERGSSPASPMGTVIDPNEARIQEYRARIEEQAAKLRAEQARLLQTQQALVVTPAASGVNAPASSTSAPPTGSPVGDRLVSARAQASQRIETEQATRYYESLFASNLALSYRAGTTPAHKEESSLRAMEVLAQKGGTGSASSAAADDTTEDPTGGADADTAGRRARSRDRDLDRATGKSYRLFEGTVIEAVLTNRLDGSFSGPVNGLVTTAVYSHDRQKLLIPQGSRVLGEVHKVDSFGQQRLAVSFHRLIMPDGYSMSLDKPHGLNQVGETGLVDQINHHYLQVFGVSLALGAIAGLSQANTRYGADTSAADAYRQGVATSLSQSSLNILDRYLNVLPTFTIREGHRLKVYLTDDLLVPAYDAHRMPADL
jgi:type IV secretory pathway VirB10-like protein